MGNKISCENCGGCCCKWFGSEYIEEDYLRKRFYSARGCKIVVNGKFKIALVPHICPKLKDGKCSIYEGRPIICAIAEVGNEICLACRKLEGVK